MYVFRNEGISSAEDRVVATQATACVPDDYQFRRLEYPNIYIPNRGAAWSISFKPEDSEEKSSLRRNIKSYNHYLDRLDSIKGFRSYFAEHLCCVSKEEIAKNWSKMTADFVFSKASYIFSTDLTILGDYLVDASIPKKYEAEVDDVTIELPIGKSADFYPTQVNGRPVIWNWVDNGHDFCISLWELLGTPDYSNGKDDEEQIGISEFYYDAYDQFRYEPPEPQLVRVFKKLESLGYITSYTVEPAAPDALWNYYGKSNGSIDFAVVDTSFMKNKLIMEQIRLLACSSWEDAMEKPYFLTDRTGKQFLSAVSGELGGHKKLKIYGSLDCPSAARYLAKGQYAQNRVFFIDEETAIAAGYRPCAVCMPEAYKNWKKRNEK